MKLYGLAILLTMMSSMGFAQDVDLSLSGKRIIQHVEVELTPSQKRALNKFKRKGDFYGAVAVNQSDLSEDAMGVMWNAHTLKQAQEMALRSCQIKTTQPDACILFVSLVPANMSAKPASISLTLKAIDSFKRFLRARRLTAFGAFAANDLWGWGWTTSGATKQEAANAALGSCQKGAKNAGRRQSEKWRKAVIDPGKNRCKILYTFKPY